MTKIPTNFQLCIIPSTGGLIGRFCGNDLPPILTSTASRMSILFESDESISHEGFTANYVIMDAATGKKERKIAIVYQIQII